MLGKLEILIVLACATALVPVAAADPADCAASYADASVRHAAGGKNDLDSAAQAAAAGGVGAASQAVTQVTLDVPPRGPLNPDTPGALAGTGYDAGQASSDAGFALARAETDATLAYLAC